MDAFRYLVYKDPDDSNYKAKRDNWSLESSNSDALTVLNYAVANSENKGPIALKGDGGTGSAFVLTGKLDLIDKNVSLIGVNQMASSNNSSTTSFGGGPVFKKNYATAEPFVDMTCTAFTKTELKNISIIGNGTSGDIGIKAHDLRERMPAFDNVMITGFGTGMELSKAVFTDIRGLSIFSCLTTGLQLKSTLAKSNVLNFYGGRIVSNPTDILVDGSAGVDVKFFGTRIEGLASGHTKSVNIASGNYAFGFYGCSFEKNSETNPIIVEDAGNNNTYFNCRFDSDVNYIPFHLTSTARNINISHNFFQANTAAIVATITIDSGAVNTNLLNNTKSTSTVGTVTLSDSGTTTRCIGNASIGISDKGLDIDGATSTVKVPHAFGGGRGITGPGGVIYLPLFAGHNINTNSSTESFTTLPLNFTFAPTKVSVKVVSNTGNGNTVITFRDDGADVTNSTVTVASTDAAGTLKESSAITATIASGSLVCWKVDATAVTTGSVTISVLIQGYIY